MHHLIADVAEPCNFNIDTYRELLVVLAFELACAAACKVNYGVR